MSCDSPTDEDWALKQALEILRVVAFHGTDSALVRELIAVQLQLARAEGIEEGVNQLAAELGMRGAKS